MLTLKYAYLVAAIISFVIWLALYLHRKGLRKDLVYDAFLTGVSMVIVAIPIYLLLDYLSPNFIEGTWLWQNLTGIKFLKIRIEDLIFYFLTGFSIAPFYLYWKSEKLRKIPIV